MFASFERYIAGKCNKPLGRLASMNNMMNTTNVKEQPAPIPDRYHIYICNLFQSVQLQTKL